MTSLKPLEAGVVVTAISQKGILRLREKNLLKETGLQFNPPGSSVHGILQAIITEWIVMLSSRGSSRPRDGTCVSFVSGFGRWVLYH